MRVGSSAAVTSALESRIQSRGPSARALSRTCAVSAATSVGAGDTKSTLELRATSSRPVTSVPMRSSSSRASSLVCRTSSGSAASMSSRCPRTTVIGVRSSCPTSSRSSRWVSTERWTRSSIRLTAPARADRSSRPRTATRVVRSRSSMESVARRSSSMGRSSRSTPNHDSAPARATVTTADAAYRPMVPRNSASAAPRSTARARAARWTPSFSGTTSTRWRPEAVSTVSMTDSSVCDSASSRSMSAVSDRRDAPSPWAETHRARPSTMPSSLSKGGRFERSRCARTTCAGSVRARPVTGSAPLPAIWRSSARVRARRVSTSSWRLRRPSTHTAAPEVSRAIRETAMIVHVSRVRIVARRSAAAGFIRPRRPRDRVRARSAADRRGGRCRGSPTRPPSTGRGPGRCARR